MDEILHHFETMGNHFLLVATGESLFQGFLGGAKWIRPIHSLILFVSFSREPIHLFPFRVSEAGNQGT